MSHADWPEGYGPGVVWCGAVLRDVVWCGVMS